MNKQNAVPSVILFKLNNGYPGKLSTVFGGVLQKLLSLFLKFALFTTIRTHTIEDSHVTEMGES